MLSSTSEQKASDTSPVQHNSCPKKEGADEVALYKLISLIHRIEKVLDPTLILQSWTRTNLLRNQSAFIKRKIIHCN